MDAGSSGEAAASEGLLRWCEAWNAHDVEAISALMTDDVRYEDPSAPAAVMHGRAQVEQYVRAAFAAIPDLHLDKLEVWVTPGGGVISSWFRFSGTFRAPLTAPGLPPFAPTDRSIELFGMDRSEIKDGRLARHQIFRDMVELGRQIGAFPPRGTRPRRGRAGCSTSPHTGSGVGRSVSVAAEQDGERRRFRSGLLTPWTMCWGLAKPALRNARSTVAWSPSRSHRRVVCGARDVSLERTRASQRRRRRCRRDYSDGSKPAFSPT